MQFIKKHLPQVTVLLVFFLAGGGHFIRTGSAAGWSVLFGFYTASIFYYVPALVTASGLLQRKLFNMIFLLVVGVLLALFRRFVSVPLIGVGFYSALSIITLWFLDMRDSRKADFVLASSDTFPKKLKKPRLLMQLFTLFFRLLPCPAPIGLYKIGKPDDYSEILVTGNYSLTLKRVVQALKGKKCWLLVCDSRGINIWCSALAGRFDTDKIIQAISLTALGEKTRSRSLTLPQLCAAGVSLEKLENETGFSGRFGPAAIGDYEAYQNDPADRSLRLVRFPLANRIEMAFGTMLIPSVILFFIFNFIDISRLTVILPAALIVSILNAVLFPHRFVKNVFLWSFIFAGVIFGISFLGFSVLFEPPSLSYSLTLGLLSLYLVNEFAGWSPLVKFDMFSSCDRPGISVDQGTCTGCGRCSQVCPKGVFDIIDNRSSPARLAECISCGACLFQCPEKAIFE